MANASAGISSAARAQAGVPNAKIVLSINAPLFYSNIARQDFITQPQFIRWRARYRGPRESFKINSEIKSFHYDVAKIYQKLNLITNFGLSGVALLYLGGSFSGTYYNWENSYISVTMGDESGDFDVMGEGSFGNQNEYPLEIYGSIALMARIEAMRSRFRRVKTLGG